MNTLVDEFVATGLLQFGLFGEDQKPFQTHLDLLPSYPQLFKQVVAAALPLVTGVDRLVCRADSLPFGVAMGLETHIPLVYSRGIQQAAVHDLVGAYDIGHPALLIVQELRDPEALSEFIQQAHGVGLVINRVLAVLTTGHAQISQSLEVQSLVSLPDILDHLVTVGQLPDGHSQHILNWLNHHPG